MTPEERLKEFVPHKLFIGILKTGELSSTACCDEKGINECLRKYAIFELYDLRKIDPTPYIEKSKE